jgi:hypothetical protein
VAKLSSPERDIFYKNEDARHGGVAVQCTLVERQLVQRQLVQRQLGEFKVVEWQVGIWQLVS